MNITALLHSPTWMGLSRGAEVTLPFFELHQKSSHPRLKEGILEVDSAEPAASLGSTYFKFLEPIILMKSGLKKADSDAYAFFLRREKHRIDSSQAILQPLAAITTSVALAILIPPTCSFLVTVVTTVVVSTLSFRLIEFFYEVHIENLTVRDATEEEKQGAKRFCKAQNDHSRLEKKLSDVKDVGARKKRRLSNLLKKHNQTVPFEDYMPTPQLVKKWRWINLNQLKDGLEYIHSVTPFSLIHYLVRPLEKRHFLGLLAKKLDKFDQAEQKQLLSTLSVEDLLELRERQRSLPR